MVLWEKICFPNIIALLAGRPTGVFITEDPEGPSSPASDLLLQARAPVSARACGPRTQLDEGRQFFILENTLKFVLTNIKK